MVGTPPRPLLLQRFVHSSLGVGRIEGGARFQTNLQAFSLSFSTYSWQLPEAWVELVATGEATFLIIPDGTLISLFWKPDLAPPDPDPHRAFTRVNHLAFDIDPQLFDYAVEVLRRHQVTIDHDPVSRPTGRGIYVYDPDGFLIEIRCDPMNA